MSIGATWIRSQTCPMPKTILDDDDDDDDEDKDKNKDEGDDDDDDDDDDDGDDQDDVTMMWLKMAHGNNMMAAWRWLHDDSCNVEMVCLIVVVKCIRGRVSSSAAAAKLRLVHKI